MITRQNEMDIINWINNLSIKDKGRLVDILEKGFISISEPEKREIYQIANNNHYPLDFMGRVVNYESEIEFAYRYRDAFSEEYRIENLSNGDFACEFGKDRIIS